MKTINFESLDEVNICVALESYISNLVSTRDRVFDNADSEHRDSFLEYYDILISEYSILLSKFKF